MKAKVDIRIVMPKVNLFRSRVENPSKELTSQIRSILGKVVADTINENQLTIKAKFIDEVAKLNLTYKSPAHEAKVNSVLEDFFSVIAAPSQAALDALIGTPTDDTEPADADEEADEEADEPEVAETDEFEE